MECADRAQLLHLHRQLRSLARHSVGNSVFKKMAEEPNLKLGTIFSRNSSTRSSKREKAFHKRFRESISSFPKMDQFRMCPGAQEFTPFHQLERFIQLDKISLNFERLRFDRLSRKRVNFIIFKKGRFQFHGWKSTGGL